MSDPRWDDVRRIADELELKIHLGTMEARDRWRELEPRLEQLEKALTVSSERVGAAVEKELTSLGNALKRLRDEIAQRLN